MKTIKFGACEAIIPRWMTKRESKLLFEWGRRCDEEAQSRGTRLHEMEAIGHLIDAADDFFPEGGKGYLRAIGACSKFVTEVLLTDDCMGRAQ